MMFDESNRDHEEIIQTSRGSAKKELSKPGNDAMRQRPRSERRGQPRSCDFAKGGVRRGSAQQQSSPKARTVSRSSPLLSLCPETVTRIGLRDCFRRCLPPTSVSFAVEVQVEQLRQHPDHKSPNSRTPRSKPSLRGLGSNRQSRLQRRPLDSAEVAALDLQQQPAWYGMTPGGKILGYIYCHGI